MSDKLKNVLIGLFAMLAIVITIGIVMFLQPSIGDGKKTLNVRFSNIQGVSIGTRVTFAGKPIGEVAEISEVANARQDQKDAFGRIYYYQLKLKIDSSINVYSSDIIAVQTTGLVGEKSIGITPRAKKNGERPYLLTNEIIFAKSVDSFENTAQQISQLTDKIDVAVNSFNSWFDSNSNELTVALSSMSTLLQEINNQSVVSSLNASINTFTSNMDHVNSVIENAKANHTFDKFNLLVENLAITSTALSSDGKNILQNVKELSDNLTSNSSSLGKLINNENFYLNINAILSKANTLMNDINHYGLLFQYDKKWQRIRTKRANVLTALNSSKQFKSYFEKEIDGINTSLSRINRLVKKANTTKQKNRLINSKRFKNDFATLLRNVENMMDNLKLYNKEIFEKTNAQ